MEQKFIESTLGLMDFIADSPSSFHAVQTVCSMLDNAGFKAMDEKEEWKLKAGSSYYTVRNSSAVIAFRLPKGDISGYSIISAHTDSPVFKIKENPEIVADGKYTTLNVEAYGGMLMAPWFDRPLSVAGRVFLKKTLKQVLVDIDRDLCLIPNLCIHQNRDVNKGYEYKVQKDLLPLIAQGDQKGSLNALVAKTLDVSEKDIADSELYLYNRTPARIWGLDNEFFSSPRIDDLMCAYCGLKALLNASESKTSKISMLALFDNEEVGSTTKQGAASDFLATTAGRIAEALKWSYQKQCAVKASSFMLSADNGHSFHPNRPEVCDPVNRPVMNGGVLIKYAGNQKYTTDAYSAAFLKDILDKAKVPYQVYHNNSNFAGGSTLGNISQTQFSVPTVDIGAAQLAMHSPYETAGCCDTFYLTEGMTAFLEA